MRWLRWLFWALVVLLVLAGIYGVFTVRRSFPQTTGEVAVPGLMEPVQVVRDVDGVPHIYATNKRDLYLAQGYVEAQDRFWQMDFFRHIGSARLSEMFGESQLDTDRFLRSLGLVELAERELELMDPSSREILEWYAQGVNAYLAEHDGSEVSVEYAILGLINSGYQIEPWHPVSTLTWAKMMSWDLSGNIRAEIERAILSSTIPVDRVEQLYPDFPDRHPTVLEAAPNEATATRPPPIPDAAMTALASAQAGTQAIWDLTGGGFEGIGSNNWVIGEDLTRTGGPLLANDPHLGIRMPSIWYQIGLHCTGDAADCVPDIAGFTFAGSPGVIVGHNTHIAWGVTTQPIDTQDLYIEKLNPDDHDQYEVDGHWEELDKRTEVIQVAGGDPVEHVVRSTRHGPVISGTFVEEDVFDDSALPVPGDYVVSLKWQTLEPSTLVEAILGINHATTFEDFREAASLWDIAPQHLVYADVEGNIGYASTGEVPIRENHDGRYPVPGWSGEFEWDGIVPSEEMPWILNPTEGYVVTANQPVTRVGEGPFDMLDAAYGYRANRIGDLLRDGTPHSVESLQRLQMDSRDGGAESLIPYLLDCTDCVKTSDQFQEMRQLIEEWVYRPSGDQLVFREDGFQSSGGSRGAAAYQAVWRHLLRLTFHDELPEDSFPGGGARWFEAVRILLESPEDPWWDDVDTNHVETRDDMIEQAMIEAHTELVGLLGSDSATWTWGRLHTASFENESLGQSGIAPIEWLLNRSAPDRVGGGRSIVNAVGWDPAEGYEVNWIPSFRMVIDLADFDASTGIHSTGNSGHAFHRHYDDMIEAWVDGTQNPLRWSVDQVEAGAQDSLILVPTPAP